MSLVGLTLIILLARTTADPDLWGHLRFGLDILSNHQITQVDRYSYLTDGQRWINHEWLTEALFAEAWKVGGELGLILFKTFIGSLILGLIIWFLLKQKLSPLRVGIVLLIFSLGLLPFLSNIRPQLFSYLFFALLCVILYYAERGKYLYLWGVVPLMAVWANLHGGFLAGIGILLGWSILHLIRQRKDWKKVIPPIIFSILAIFINPYGKDLPLFLLQTATVPRPEIDDWKPLYLLSADGGAYLIILLFSIIGILFSKRDRNPVLILILIMIAVLPLTAIRHLPLFSIAALIIAGEHIESSWEHFSTPKFPEQPSVWFSIGVFVAGITALSVLAYSLKLDHIAVKANEYPIAAAALLEKSGISGNIANEFDWGEYLIWHLGPKIKVSIDGRRETVYSTRIYKENVDFMLGNDNWGELLTQYPTDMALVYRSHTIYQLLLSDPKWVLVYEDKGSALFAAKNSQILASLQHTAMKAKVEGDGYHFP